MEWKCDKCDKLFKSKKGYISHSQMCEGVQSLECQYCFTPFYISNADF